MSSSRSIDSKREEFRKYLETAGVMDTFTRIMTMIYENEDKPADPLQFVREQFVKNSAITLELQLVQKYLESAKEKITLLETENEKLKKELENCKANMYPQLRNSAED